MGYKRKSEIVGGSDTGQQLIDALFDNDEAILAGLGAGRWHNSRFDLWQRGQSFASGASQFGADRHRFRRSGNAAGATLTRQAGFRGARYSARVSRDVGNASTAEIFLTHQFDSEEISDLAGQTIYIAADLIAGANFSAAGGLVKCRVDTGTGFNETVSEASGFATGNSSIQDSTNGAISTTSARKFFGPFAIPANATELAATFSFVPVGTAGAADFFQITNIKPCAAAPELYKPLPLMLEQAICDRYFEAIPNFGGSSVSYSLTGARVASGLVLFDWQYRTRKRREPSIYTSSGLACTSGVAPSGNQYCPYNRIVGSYMNPTGAVTLSFTGTSRPDGTLLHLTAASSWPGTNNDRCELYVGSTAIIGSDAEI